MTRAFLFNRFLILVCSIFFGSCVVKRPHLKTIDGVYRQVSNTNVRLVFNGDSFALVDPYSNDLALYTCCDTITKGIWVKENSFLCLSTPKIKSSRLEASVVERRALSADTIYIEIHSPIEDYFKRYKRSTRDIYYMVSPFNAAGRLLDFSVNRYTINLIKIPIEDGQRIKKFDISAYPGPLFGGREIGIKWIITPEYTVKDVNNNYFDVTILGLSYEYLTYRRLNRDFVRIVSSNELEWDGEIYRKEK